MTHESSNEPSKKTSGDAPPILTVIARIKDGSLDAALLAVDDRRRCVETLRAEGYSIAEIAQVLRCHERTVSRDLEQIRADHALAPDAGLTERMVGEMVRQAETSMTRLRRIARERGASAMERQMAESAAWRVYREMIDKLQSLGYLPRMPTNVVAEVYQHLSADPIAGYEELAAQLLELERLDRETGLNDSQRDAQLADLEDEVRRGRLSTRIARLYGEGGGHEAN